MKAPRRRFTIPKITCWTIAIVGGGAVAWIGLSFLFVQPVDESKVHPDLTRKAVKSSLWMASPSPEEGLILFNMAGTPGAGMIGYAFPNVNEDRDIMFVRNPLPRGIDESEVSLEQYPHTRRAVVIMIEEGAFGQIPENEVDYSKVTSDPFALTRIEVRSWIAKLRAMYSK
ncbi:MAG: hypothetical protein AAF585_25515 [Verrucomicrobiota bacterium]